MTSFQTPMAVSVVQFTLGALLAPIVVVIMVAAHRERRV